MSLAAALRLGLVGPLCAATLFLAGPASADDLQNCIDQGNAQGIQNPTCVEQNGQLVPEGNSTDPLGSGTDSGIPGWFIALAVLMAAVGIGVTLWRVSTARKLATESGMDPNLATGMALMDDNGLSATYLAANLRGSKAVEPPSPPSSSPPASVADRLGELKSLLDSGTITQGEYEERRKAIIDSV